MIKIKKGPQKRISISIKTITSYQDQDVHLISALGSGPFIRTSDQDRDWDVNLIEVLRS